MGKIRRGGFVFLTWTGDHAPRHVHVYRDGKFVLKWDLESKAAMKGKAPRDGSCVSSLNWKRKGSCEDPKRFGKPSSQGF